MHFDKNILVLAVSMPLITLTACAATDTKKSAGQYIDDSVLMTKVNAALLSTSAWKSSETTMHTYKGKAQLSGFISSVEQANDAVAIALGVEGAASVKNDMSVKRFIKPI